MKKYDCRCCGYATLDEPPGGTYDICPICFWEDDISLDPNTVSGPNHMTLIEAQDNFTKYGACHPNFLKNVRKPNKEEAANRDPKWRVSAKSD